MMNDKELLEKWIEYFWIETADSNSIPANGLDIATIKNRLACIYLIKLSRILDLPCSLIPPLTVNLVDEEGNVITTMGTISVSNVLTDIVEILSMSGESFLPESIRSPMVHYVSIVLETSDERIEEQEQQVESERGVGITQTLVERIGLLNGGSVKEQLDKAIRRWLAVGWMKYRDHPTYGGIDNLLARYTMLHVFPEGFSVEYSAEVDGFLVTLPGDEQSSDIMSPKAVYERLVTQNLTDVITAVDRYRLLVLITSMDDDSTAGTFRLTN